MKNTFYLLLLAGFAVINGCTFKQEINTDPNNPRDISNPATLLTSSQVGFGYTYGGAYARYTSLYVNQLTGYGNQSIPIDNFSFLTSETDDAWDNSYRILGNLNQLIQRAPGSPYYTGVAKIMKALVLGTVAQNFGASPYRTALRATEDGKGYQPSYDSGPQNYEDIQALLDSAITEVQATESILTPGADDDLYGGDMAKWLKLAYALKARYYLHSGRVNSADLALSLSNALLAQGISAKLAFAGASVGSQNPLYQYQTQRGDLATGRLLTDTLRAFRDPRAPIYVTDTTLNGSNPGLADGDVDTVYFSPASPNVNPNDPVYFVNSAEPYFIAAEIQFGMGDKAAAAASHNAGVMASLVERGVDLSESGNQAFVTGYGSEADSTITLDKIMVQKWLALYLNPESFADWRRTGIPQTKLPVNNVTGDKYVRKFPYPQKERTLNAAHLPAEPTPPAIGHVWWDPN